MLTENNIIDAVCKYLNSNGYEIKQSLNTLNINIFWVQDNMEVTEDIFE